MSVDMKPSVNAEPNRRPNVTCDRCGAMMYRRPSTLALNAGYRLNARMQLTTGIDNLFNRTYSEHLNLAGSADFGYPALPVRINEPGRNLWLKLNLAL